jgi:hypothetical protein
MPGWEPKRWEGCPPRDEAAGCSGGKQPPVPGVCVKGFVDDGVGDGDGGGGGAGGCVGKGGRR